MIRLHQFLHGYREGHRLLGGSATLPPQDARAMLVMSDSLADASSIGEGYLTGYPLDNVGGYVLAHTWSAPEASRPGCVWTHSLLLDFADLASISSLTSILGLFRYPEGTSARPYGEPVDIPLLHEREPLPPHLLTSAALLVDRMYGAPQRPVVSFGLPAEDFQQLAIALWEQQWPRLRRTFRFCVGSSFGRRMLDYGFDLLGVSGTPHFRRSTEEFSFVALSQTSTETSNLESSWIGICLSDLADPYSGGGLRNFLRDYAADVPFGRSAFVPLTVAYVLSQVQPPHLVQRADALAALLKALPLQSSDGVRLRELAIESVLSQIEEVRPESVSYVVRNAACIPHDHLERWGGRLAARIWLGEPAEFWEFANAGEMQARLLFDRVGQQDEASIAAVLGHIPEESLSSLAGYHSVLITPLFWRYVGEERAAIMNLVPRDTPDADKIVRAILDSEDDRAAGETVDHFGSSLAAAALLGRISVRCRIADSDWEWISVLSREDRFLPDLLQLRPTRSEQNLSRLSRISGPDVPTSDAAVDPWADALLHSGVLSRLGANLWLASFAVARAFGEATRAKAHLLSLGLDSTYRALQESRLQAEAWDQLDDRLPRKFGRSSWDRCARVREGISQLCNNGHIPASEFAQITRESSIFRDLVSAMADSDEGKTYLSQVAATLESRFDPKRDDWAHIVHEQISSGWFRFS